MNQENTETLNPLGYLSSRIQLLKSTFTSYQTATYPVHGSVPRNNDVNLGSRDNRASTSITYFKDSHPLPKDRSAILVS